MSKIIQETFGEKIIAAVGDFARADLKTVTVLEADEFAHVSDARLRTTLAEAYYGTRWLYKLGLALLVKDAEQMAHVRAQVMDYGAVCEGLLSDALHHALVTTRMAGQKYLRYNFKNPKATINWRVVDKLAQLTRQSFFWHIEVAFEENIIDQNLHGRLDTMRIERNTVHMRARAANQRAFIGTSRYLFETTFETVRQTKAWRAANI